MFRKSILQLGRKDKLFFLLIAILAIVGIFFGVRAGISYLSGTIKGHKQELNATNNQVSQLETAYGPQVKETLKEIKEAAATLNDTGQEIKKVAKKFDNGLLTKINSLSPWGAGCLVVVLWMGLLGATAGICLLVKNKL